MIGFARSFLSTPQGFLHSPSNKSLDYQLRRKAMFPGAFHAEHEAQLLSGALYSVQTRGCRMLALKGSI